MPLLSLSGQARHLGLKSNKLAPCPGSPNCVCSDDPQTSRWCEPFKLLVDPEKSWSELESLIVADKAARIATNTGDYLHAEYTSAIFGFVDDLELHLRPDERIIAVRSASRLGYSDLGVNRARVERLRTALREKGITS